MIYRIAVAAVLGLSALPAVAQEMLNGPAIAAALSGNTVQGGMADGAVYAEFYDADGAIKAEGYGGTWTVEGDTMCLDYGSDPATCYGVSLSGTEVTWYIDGAVVGTGTLVEGNANGF